MTEKFDILISPLLTKILGSSFCKPTNSKEISACYNISLSLNPFPIAHTQGLFKNFFFIIVIKYDF